MKSEIKDKVIAIGFCVLLAAALVLNIAIPDGDLSTGERRKLKQLPEMTARSVFSGDYFEELEEYGLDQFVLRDTLRSLKSTVRLNVFMQLESNDLFIRDGSIYKLDPQLDEVAVEGNARKMLSVAQSFWADADMYYCVVPEKTVTVDSAVYPELDRERFGQLLEENLVGVQQIDIYDLLGAEDYYRTDPHWRQEKIVDVADRILTTMGNPVIDTTALVPKTARSFYGAYSGQLPLRVEEDELVYLTDPVIEAASVYVYDTGKTRMIYNDDKLTADDPYDYYLDGAVSLLRIDNPSGTEGKQLVIFRDSFGSSIAPLLLSDYSTVMLVDLRYIRPSALERYVIRTEETDVLFLYSERILNNKGVF